MKIIQLISALWIVFVACHKDVCLDCKHSITTSAKNVQPSVSTSNYILCNEEIEEIKKRDGRVTTTVTSGVTVTQKEKVECR